MLDKTSSLQPSKRVSKWLFLTVLDSRPHSPERGIHERSGESNRMLNMRCCVLNLVIAWQPEQFSHFDGKSKVRLHPIRFHMWKNVCTSMFLFKEYFTLCCRNKLWLVENNFYRWNGKEHSLVRCLFFSVLRMKKGIFSVDCTVPQYCTLFNWPLSRNSNGAHPNQTILLLTNQTFMRA